jgi:hypothetical protein
MEQKNEHYRKEEVESIVCNMGQQPGGSFFSTSSFFFTYGHDMTLVLGEIEAKL